VSERPYVIGLTGNIATGKSVVGSMLSKLGAAYVDADRLAHQVMARGMPAWKQIVATFGTQVLGADGEIDRAKLGPMVFSDPRALAQLEAIVHPDVIARTRDWIASAQAPVLVIEAIKLIESGMADQLCDAVWVVYAPREVQLRRLVGKRGLSCGDAVVRVDAQPTQESKIARADVVIDNGGSLDATALQVERAWAEIDRVDCSTRQ
jgi:dephospho-CoA kinase